MITRGKRVSASRYGRMKSFEKCSKLHSLAKVGGVKAELAAPKFEKSA
jgi:hypothetical protein